MAKKKPFAAPDGDPEWARAYSVYRKNAARLRKKKGVVAVSFGLKSTKGCYGFEYLPHLPKPKREKVTYAILIYVNKKLHEASLPKNQLLPTQIGGVPTDVIEMPKGRCSAGIGFDVDFNPLIGGAPIGIAQEFGTLGIVVTGVADGQQRLLTCAHVAFGIPPSQNPGPVFQPPAGVKVAVGASETNGLTFGPPLDCATVTLNGAKPAVSGQISSVPGQVNGIVPRDPSIITISVMKVGVKSGLTSGRIVDPFFFFPNADLGINFVDQYLIASSNPALPFANSGDSGALVFAKRGNGLKAVGLLIGVTSSGDAVALPITDALNGLGLQL